MRNNDTLVKIIKIDGHGNVSESQIGYERLTEKHIKYLTDDFKLYIKTVNDQKILIKEKDALNYIVSLRKEQQSTAEVKKYKLHKAPKPNMIEAYVCMWKNYAKFSGRARRSEFWYVILAEFIISIIFSFGKQLIDLQFFSILYCLYVLASFIPGLALRVRRLHDVGVTGHIIWLSSSRSVLAILAINTVAVITMVIWLVILIIAIAMLAMYCTDSDQGTNKYGESKKYYYK